MKSIRRALLVRLLVGLLLLLVAAGGGIYLAVRSGLIRTLDAELAIDAQLLRFTLRGDNGGGGGGDEAPGSIRPGGSRRVQARLPAYDELGSGYLYQGWTSDGVPVERSASLGDALLPFPADQQDNPSHATRRLDDGTLVRVMSFRTQPGGRGRGKGERRRAESATIISVARDLHEVERTLLTLLGGIAVAGLVSAAAAVLLVRAAVNRGLRPLRSLEGQAREIDAETLDLRLQPDDAPRELRPVYACLNELLERIEAGFDRERRFSADLAHEIRTPIAELKTLSEVALKWPDQAGQESFRETLDIAVHLESVVDSLLKLARLESGAVPLKCEPVDLGHLCRTSWDEVSHTAAARDLTVVFEIEGDVVTDTDPDLLRHVLSNLLSNAAEYADRGGEVCLLVRSGLIQIKNPASTLSEGDLAHLFERHWRRDNVLQAAGGHAGLGLSLARACAEALGLSLTATLEDGMLRMTLAEA